MLSYVGLGGVLVGEGRMGDWLEEKTWYFFWFFFSVKKMKFSEFF